MESVEIRITKNVNTEEIFNLYIEGEWWAEQDRQYIDQITRVVNGSESFAIAVLDGKAIGMGRAISDGISDAYIQDVVVYSKYRGKGIGKQIINALINDLKKKNIPWIALIANPDTSPFYEKLGFSKMENFTPMLLKGTEDV